MNEQYEKLFFPKEFFVDHKKKTNNNNTLNINHINREKQSFIYTNRNTNRNINRNNNSMFRFNFQKRN